MSALQLSWREVILVGANQESVEEESEQSWIQSQRPVAEG